MTDEFVAQTHNSFDFAQTHSTPPDPQQLFSAIINNNLNVDALANHTAAAASSSTANASTHRLITSTTTNNTQWAVSLQACGVPADVAIALAARLNVRRITPTHVLTALTNAEIHELGLASDAYLLDRLRTTAAEVLRATSGNSAGSNVQTSSNERLFGSAAAAVLPELPFGGLADHRSPLSLLDLADAMAMDVKLNGAGSTPSSKAPSSEPVMHVNSNGVAAAVVQQQQQQQQQLHLPFQQNQQPSIRAAIADSSATSSEMSTSKKRKGDESTGGLGVQENKHVQLVEEPNDAILSGRSTHTYRVSVYRQRVIELKIFMEDEHGVPLPDFVTVESQNTHESSDGYLLVTLKLRLKPDRLQLCNVVFELLVESFDSTTTTTRQLRARACIVCSHITRQREAAQRKLDQWNEAQSLSHLRNRILDKYHSYRFTRQLSEDGMIYLLCIALQCSRDELAAAANRSKEAARLREFDKWFSRCLKTIDRVRPYWDNGCIFGFLSRPDAENLVTHQSNGIAIIRLSESVPKALAVTCKTADGVIENKLMEHTACANCQRFVESLSSFGGNLTKVLHVSGAEVGFGDAFPPVADILNSKEGGYDELAK